MQTFILTNNKCYTNMEVVDMFSEYVRPENLEMLVNHLTMKGVSEDIISFTELDDGIGFNIGCGSLIKVSKKS